MKNDLYEHDFVAWSERTAELLRSRRFSEIEDVENLAEEIEDLGKNHRHAVASQLLRLLLHQIKRQIQPARETVSWRHSIVNAQDRIARRLADSPSLYPYLESEMPRIYAKAVSGARFETGVHSVPLPETCPFSLTQLLEKFDLEWPCI